MTTIPDRTLADPQEWNAQALTEEARVRAENCALWRSLIDEFVNKGNLDFASDVWAQDYQWHPGDGVSPTMDRVSHREDFAQLRSTFPDLHQIVEDMIAEGDRVVTRWRITATHTHPLRLANGNTVAATGKVISWTGTTVHRIADGKIAEGWINYDRAGIDEQLGWRA